MTLSVEAYLCCRRQSLTVAAPTCHCSLTPGLDALGSLLALSLSCIPPASMAGAAFAAILQHPELTAALTAAEGVDEEALEEQQQVAGGAGSDSGDAAAALEQVGVRPELAAAVAGSPGSSGFYTAWALLMAHVLAAPADSHGRRLLVQSVKEVHALVPALMDALVPLLPLDTASGSRRRDSSGGSTAGGSTPVGVAAAAASSGGGGSAAAFASQLAELGPYPSGHSDDFAALSPAQQQHAQRFAVLLYAAVLQALPASARLWFADLRDRGTAAATERYTSGAVSGQLLAAELAAVTQARGVSFGCSSGAPCWPARVLNSGTACLPVHCCGTYFESRLSCCMHPSPALADCPCYLLDPTPCRRRRPLASLTSSRCAPTPPAGRSSQVRECNVCYWCRYVCTLAGVRGHYEPGSDGHGCSMTASCSTLLLFEVVGPLCLHSQ